MKRIALLSLVAFMAMGTAYADIDNLDIGGDLMAEYFFSSELQAKDSETDFLRTEGHLWFQADLDDNVMARISLEFDRALGNLNSPNPNSNDLSLFGSDDLDLFLEEAFIKVADISGSGLTLSVGRQFLNFGDNSAANDFNGWWGPGFIISDGNPGSPASIAQLGSYEIDPFDAIVATYELENAALNVIYARAAEDFSANNNDDIGVTALYGSYFGIEGHQIDAYFTWTDNNSNVDVDESMIIGARAAGDIMPELAYKVEVAYQFQDDNNPLLEVDALAIQAGINYHPDMDYNPNIGFIYTFLEGDNGGGFFAMDGKTYGLLADSVLGAGQITNANIFNLNGGWEPMQDVAWTADLYYIMLDEDVLIAGVGEDDGGFEIDTQIDYRFNDNLTTFLGGGVYFLGDATGRDDEAYFFRTGMKVNF
jgi:hypothetical protein